MKTISTCFLKYVFYFTLFLKITNRKQLTNNFMNFLKIVFFYFIFKNKNYFLMKWPNRLKTFQQQILRIWVKCYVLLYNPPLFLAFMSLLSTFTVNKITSLSYLIFESKEEDLERCLVCIFLY